MKKIAVIGHFGGTKPFLGGQSVKTITVCREIEKKAVRVKRIDTYNFKIRFLKILFQCMEELFVADELVLILAHNGLKYLVPIIITVNKLFKKNIHFVAVGGWIPEFLDKRSQLKEIVKKCDHIYVQTEMIKRKLNERGLNNVCIMYNFKDMKIVGASQIETYEKDTFNFCMFSRVMKEKGIEEAIESIMEIHEKFGYNVRLDIYGAIEDRYRERFLTLMDDSPKYIQYKGIVDFNESVNVLKNYYILLFPTYYEGEGFAGTLIDAFSSGLPVICTNWRYNEEIVTNGYNGYIYDYKKKELLTQLIKKACENPKKIQEMRYACVETATLYVPEKAAKPLIDRLNIKGC